MHWFLKKTHLFYVCACCDGARRLILLYSDRICSQELFRYLILQSYSRTEIPRHSPLLSTTPLSTPSTSFYRCFFKRKAWKSICSLSRNKMLVFFLLQNHVTVFSPWLWWMIRPSWIDFVSIFAWFFVDCFYDSTLFLIDMSPVCSCFSLAKGGWRVGGMQVAVFSWSSVSSLAS